MRLGRVVDFKSDVLGTSRRSGRKALRSDSDIWRKLPEGMCWFACHIEASDIERIFVYGDREWKETFGTFSLNAVVQGQLVPDDQHHHKSSIEGLMQTLSTGHKFRSLALTAFSADGPFVMIDGSHRAAAMLRLGMLSGQSCYVGFHQHIGKDHDWFRNTLCGIAGTAHDGWASPAFSLNIQNGHTHGNHSPGVNFQSVDHDQGSGGS